MNNIIKSLVWNFDSLMQEEIALPHINFSAIEALRHLFGSGAYSAPPYPLIGRDGYPPSPQGS